MAEKKYYWLKLHKDFFKRHDIRIIESMENGKDYILFYLKLLVESVSHNGELRFSDTIPYNEQMLSTITNTNIDIVRSAMKVFSELGMIEIMEDSTIFMNEVEKMIGSSSSDEQTKESTRLRVQRHRQKQKEIEQQELQKRYCNVTCNGELEKEKELDTDKDNKGIVEQDSTAPYKEIIDYLNLKANTHYKHTTKSTQTKIKARLKEKFTVEDFKAVIDIKCSQWLGDKKMEPFLRPETLFTASHFESYLNEARRKTAKPKSDWDGLAERLDKEAVDKLSSMNYEDYGDFN